MGSTEKHRDHHAAGEPQENGDYYTTQDIRQSPAQKSPNSRLI